jgi:hypothetical protein
MLLVYGQKGEALLFAFLSSTKSASPRTKDLWPFWLCLKIFIVKTNVAELVDAMASGAIRVLSVQVRILLFVKKRNSIKNRV